MTLVEVLNELETTARTELEATAADAASDSINLRSVELKRSTSESTTWSTPIISSLTRSGAASS